MVLFMCCHPALTPASAIALTLRAVGGLTTAEIANAFLVPEATMAQRISPREAADQGLRRAVPAADGRRAPGRASRSVLHVLYLIFNEGYASSTGPELHRADLSEEAIRLARMVQRMLPDDPEVAGLLALMLLIDARRPARTDADGRSRPVGGAGPDALGPGPHRGGRGPPRRGDRIGAGRRVPAPGRDRRHP